MHELYKAFQQFDTTTIIILALLLAWLLANVYCAIRDRDK